MFKCFQKLRCKYPPHAYQNPLDHKLEQMRKFDIYILNLFRLKLSLFFICV